MRAIASAPPLDNTVEYSAFSSMPSMSARLCLWSSTTRTRAGFSTVSILTGQPVFPECPLPQSLLSHLSIWKPVDSELPERSCAPTVTLNKRLRAVCTSAPAKCESLMLSLFATDTYGMNSSGPGHPPGANCYTGLVLPYAFSHDQDKDRNPVSFLEASIRPQSL
jgi:hypothetical protein